VAEDIAISISQDSIQKIVQARIQAEVLKALDGDGGLLVQKLVEQSINMKVRKDYQDYTFFSLLVTETIQAETKKAFEQWIANNRSKIEDAMTKAMSKDKTLAARIVDSLLKGVTDGWYFKVNVDALRKE
jgi:hypothetical protein